MEWREGYTESSSGNVPEYSEAAVRVGDDVMNWFEVERSVRQWCPMLPWISTANDIDLVWKEALSLF